MNTHHNHPRYKAIQSIFLEVCQTSALQQPITQQPILYGDLIRFVKGMATDNDHIQQAINRDLTLRRAYLSLITKLNQYDIPREARADDNHAIKQRVGEGFIVKFRTSKANPSQIYVILELEHPPLKESKEWMLHLIHPERIQMIKFPVQSIKRAQSILEAHDERLTLLHNPETAIHLIIA